MTLFLLIMFSIILLGFLVHYASTRRERKLLNMSLLRLDNLVAETTEREQISRAEEAETKDIFDKLDLQIRKLRDILDTDKSQGVRQAGAINVRDIEPGEQYREILIKEKSLETSHRMWEQIQSGDILQDRYIDKLIPAQLAAIGHNLLVLLERGESKSYIYYGPMRLEPLGQMPVIPSFGKEDFLVSVDVGKGEQEYSSRLENRGMHFSQEPRAKA